MTAHPDPFGLWLGKPAPRYTSYPPATQFRPIDPSVDDAPHLRLLAAQDTPISLYVHIPFCRELCLYCGCHSVITKRAERITAYLVALHWEIALAAEKLGKRLKVAHLHFGGGSPSALLPEQFRALMAVLRQHFDFLPEAELAIELDPRTTSPDLVEALAAEGINRASLGVQDFDESVQKIIHRIQPFELVASVVANLREAGIHAISLDVMYGLPGQTPESVTKTAEQVLTLNPHRLSLFSYAHVPSMKPYQKKLEEFGLPDELSRLAMERAVRGVLNAAGFVSIGIDHFARVDDPLALAQKEGRLTRNFQGYTDDPAPLMLGFGASSISDAGDISVQNEPDLVAYQQKIVARQLPLKRQCPRTAEDHARGALIESLMCNFAVDVPEGYEAELARLEPFITAGLVTRTGNRIEVDQTYRMAVRAVATVFDQYFNPAQLSSKVA